jgi:hypothetical protein
MKINRPKDGDYRYKTKFLWFPKRFDSGWYWLETVTIRQIYFYHGTGVPGWCDVCLSDSKTELPLNLPQEPENNNEPLNQTLKRFIDKGVHQTKIILTESPSVVTWSKTRKCLVGGKYQPDALEVFDDGNGNLKLTVDNNILISLQNRSELTQSDVNEINESEGIVVTNATYGKPYFRYGFIPKIEQNFSL